LPSRSRPCFLTSECEHAGTITERFPALGPFAILKVLRSQFGEQPDCDSPRRRLAGLLRGFSCAFIVATLNRLVNSVATIILRCYTSRMKTNERGRPHKPDEERKSAQLRIRLTDEERETLDKAAGGKTSTWAREILLKAAKRKS
jgi:hypothetical protein